MNKDAETVLPARNAVRNIKSEVSEPLRVPVVTKPQDIADAGQKTEASEAIKPIETAETPRQTVADSHTNREFSTKNSNEKLLPPPIEAKIEVNAQSQKQSDLPVEAKNIQKDNRVSAEPITQGVTNDSTVPKGSISPSVNSDARLKTQINLREAIGKTSTTESVDGQPTAKTSMPTNTADELKTEKPRIDVIAPDLRKTETLKFKEQTAIKIPELITESIQNEIAADKTKTDVSEQTVRLAEVSNQIAPKNLETSVSPKIVVISEASVESVQKSENAQSMTAIVNDVRESDQAPSAEAVLQRQGSVKTIDQAVEGSRDITTETKVVDEAALENLKDLCEVPIQPTTQTPVNRENQTDTRTKVANEIGIESNETIDAATETLENKQISEATALSEFNGKGQSSTDLPPTLTIGDSESLIALNPIPEADFSLSPTNSDYTNADSLTEWFYQEQERTFAENRATQDQQFQNTIEQNVAQSQTLQTNIQATIESLTRQFEQIQEFGQRSYEESNVSEDDVFENLRKATDFNSFEEPQTQPIITDDEIQARLARASEIGLPDKIEAESSARHQLQQTEDSRQQEVQEHDADEEEESQDMDFDDDSVLTRGRSMRM